MKKVSFILSAVVMTAMMLSSCNGSSSSQEGSSNEEVTIGNQVWMTKNLNVDKFRNGDPIPHAETQEEWEKAGENQQPAWCYYDNDPANGEKYGKLYNWYAVNDPRGLAPGGWHVPSDEEWTGLTDYLGGNDVAAGKLKSTSGWVDYNGNPANGTNSSGFSGIPGGSRSMLSAEYGGNSFGGIGDESSWWSSSYDDYGAYSRGLGAAVEFVTPCGADCGKERGLYVRCVRD